MSDKQLPPIPKTWAALTWQQLCDCWQAKLRYGGNADVARCAALLALIESHQSLPVMEGGGYRIERGDIDSNTGEQQYVLSSPGPAREGQGGGSAWTTTPRQLAHLARKALPWFDFPYGDQGEPEEKDEQGQVTKEGRDPVFGYVNPDWRDAMELPEQEVVVTGRHLSSLSQWEAMSEEEHNQPIIDEWNAMSREQRSGIISRLCPDKDEKELRRMARHDWKHTDEQLRQQILHSSLFTLHFALPERACTNITWHQYRALQGITQMLFQEGIADDAATELQAQFLAYILLPEQHAQTATDRFAPRHTFRYDADRAEQTVPFWRSLLTGPDAPAAVLYAMCFQTYHTALRYYEKVFPLLYQSSGKADPLHDALTGEVDTINCVMKYQGYSSPEQVYNTELPIVLSVLNTITKEAKEIEKMNAKIKRK